MEVLYNIVGNTQQFAAVDSAHSNFSGFPAYRTAQLEATLPTSPQTDLMNIPKKNKLTGGFLCPNDP